MRRGRTSFRFTAERRAILGHLVRYRYLRTSHFYDLCGVGLHLTDRAVRRLLRDFHGHGYLRRLVISEMSSGPLPRYEFVYGLSAAGVALSRDSGLCDNDYPSMPGSARNLEHEAAITDFHLAVERFSAANGWSLYWQQHGLRRGVNPDALFALTDPRRPGDEEDTTYYFLEVERARETGYRDGRSGLLRRLERYVNYQGSAACRRDWEWFDEFRVVVVVASEARQRNLLARLARELLLPMFWIAVERQDFASTVFKSPGDYEVRGYSFLD